ncbi:MAG: hypothetical protein LC118_21015 [Dehalococcoidia bacterium]|nr:hypothetical protein [Dehalococcoidia bacterium]
MRRLALAAWALVALVGPALLGPVMAARANGVPQLVKLTYIEGISNWGPKDAEGVLEFSFAEAYARIDVKNLPAQAGYTYEGWLMGGAGAPLKVGAVTVSPSGVGALETKLTGLDRYDYDTFVIGARGSSAPPGSVPADRSIAGRFTVLSENGTPKAGDAGARPGTLPDTGERVGTSTRERLGRTFTVVMITGGIAVVAVALIRREKRTR